MGLVLEYYSLYVTLLKCSDVPEVLEVQVVASDEVRMVPVPVESLSPTTTNVLFPYVPAYRFSVVPEVLLSQEIPSDEERMTPLGPNATKVLFA